MPALPMNRLGAIEVAPGTIQFGVFLPGMTPAVASSVRVGIVTEADAMRGTIPPVALPLQFALDPTYGEYWSGSLRIAGHPPALGSTWGSPGTYLYWFTVILTTGQVIDQLIDPFAREFGFQDFSAITLGYAARAWSPGEARWRTPPLSELVVYEIELNEFGGSIQGSKTLLPYLKELGVTAVEVMPVTNVATIIDWGYSPIGYFGVDERFGNRADFQEFVDVAHANGIAVILDMVYGHTDARFLYARLYAEGHLANPVMNANGTYGPQPLYATPLMRDLFFSCNNFWLSTFHADGFRYDNVDAFWDGSTTGFYPALTQATYELVATNVTGSRVSPDWSRFAPAAADAEINLVQCAEYLPDPPSVLERTFTNCTWQNATLTSAVQAACGGSLYALGMQSGLFGYPESATVGGVTLTKSAMQYVENHDHQRLVCNFGLHATDLFQSQLLQEGNRTDDPNGAYVGRWFAVQPYLILVMLGKGTPFLWQAQEIGENYYVPEDWHENGRVRIFRPVRWEYADDTPGASLSRLLRTLVEIRKNNAQFKTGDHAFVNDYANYQSKGLLLLTRSLGTRWSLVALNFTDLPQSSTFVFPTSGRYAELIDGAAADLTGVVAGVAHLFSVPSHYGRVWTAP